MAKVVRIPFQGIIQLIESVQKVVKEAILNKTSQKIEDTAKRTNKPPEMRRVCWEGVWETLEGESVPLITTAACECCRNAQESMHVTLGTPHVTGYRSPSEQE